MDPGNSDSQESSEDARVTRFTREVMSHEGGRWVVAIVGLSGVSRAASKVATRSQCDREQPMASPSCFNGDQLSFFAAARYVRDQTPPTTIVMSANEGPFFYLANRPLVPVDSINARPPEAAAAFLQRQNISYAVISHVTFDDLPLAERLLSACNILEPVAEFPPRATVFRVLPGPVADSRACGILRDFRREAGEFPPQIF